MMYAHCLVALLMLCAQGCALAGRADAAEQEEAPLLSRAPQLEAHENDPLVSSLETNALSYRRIQRRKWCGRLVMCCGGLVALVLMPVEAAYLPHPSIIMALTGALAGICIGGGIVCDSYAEQERRYMQDTV